ncbi:MAG: hypothetical protein VKO44_11830 [Cyanobacteriota bacterium]|nr:hypothetical protein [Cyanobacteriota bacterium]
MASSRPSSAQDPQRCNCTNAAQELSRYLIFLRVPLLLLAAALGLFLTQQVRDVLLAMALEPDWGEMGKAAFFAVVFGVLLWLSARKLSNLEWMRQTGTPGVWVPDVRWMSPEVVWWLPRLLGIAPLLLFAAGLLFGVGWIGRAPQMALVLLLLAAALMSLLVLRTRASGTAASVRRATGLARLVQALSVRSGESDGLFTPRSELLMMALAWFNLALITVPIARAAYGPFGGGIGHVYALLLGGALFLGLWRYRGEFHAPPGYWKLFALLLALALALPILLNRTIASGVVVPRALGPIAILFDGLAIFLVFASTFFAFSIKSGIPLLTLLLVFTLFVNLSRLNDNHAVRLLPRPASGEGTSIASPELPSLEAVLVRWLSEHGRRAQIEATSPDNPWPIYVGTAQGGGVFAAYHSAKALATLSQEVPDFPRHLFALSGVSGGSVGVALYANALDPSGDNRDIVRRVDRAFEVDHLSPVLAALMTGDATQRVYPFPVPAWDRSLGLELSFSDTPGLLDPSGAPARPPISLETPFYGSQLAGSAAAAPRPFLVLNTTEVDTGRRFLLSPFRFLSDATFHAPWRPNGDQEVRTSTAAVMSARFPLITPYAFFSGSTSQKERRSVDGGYYDNSGAVTGLEIVTELNKALVRQGLAGKAKVVPIAIVNRSSFQRGGRTDLDAGPVASRPRPPKPLIGFSALDALFSTREARVAKTLSDLGVRCGQPGRKDLCITLWPFYTVLNDQGVPLTKSPFSLPLGWSLSCQSRAFISQQLRPSPQADPKPPCPSDRALKVQQTGIPPTGFPEFETIVSQVRAAVEASSAPGRGAAPAAPVAAPAAGGRP